jgi:hypothetical protein
MIGDRWGAWNLVHAPLNQKIENQYFKKVRQWKMNEFSPKEGDRILVGNTEPLLSERIFLYIDRHGRYMCVHANDEKIYDGNKIGSFRVIHWLLAKPKILEFIDGDPVIVWRDSSQEYVRVFHSYADDGGVECYTEYPKTYTWSNCKPLPNYDYGVRKVWGSEDKH